MAKQSRRHSKNRMQSAKRFSLGAAAAENDPLLSQGFYENGDYQLIEDRLEIASIMIGRTGSGKSAILHHIQESFPTRVIDLSPEQLSLDYLSQAGIVQFLHQKEFI